jgi:hypothetical protein
MVIRKCESVAGAATAIHTALTGSAFPPSEEQKGEEGEEGEKGEEGEEVKKAASEDARAV